MASGGGDDGTSSLRKIDEIARDIAEMATNKAEAYRQIHDCLLGLHRGVAFNGVEITTATHPHYAFQWEYYGGDEKTCSFNITINRRPPGTYELRASGRSLRWYRKRNLGEWFMPSSLTADRLTGQAVEYLEALVRPGPNGSGYKRGVCVQWTPIDTDGMDNDDTSDESDDDAAMPQDAPGGAGGEGAAFVDLATYTNL